MTSVKKVLGCLNALTQDAKLETVEKIHLFLSEKLEGVSKDTLDKLLMEFKDTVQADPDPFTPIKSKNKPKVPRPPTAYNLFIKETMEQLKKETPDEKNTALMSLAALKWNEHKASLDAAGGTLIASSTPATDAPATDAPVGEMTAEVSKKTKKSKK
jgi:hypothetical protein